MQSSKTRHGWNWPRISAQTHRNGWDVWHDFLTAFSTFSSSGHGTSWLSKTMTTICLTERVWFNGNV